MPNPKKYYRLIMCVYCGNFFQRTYPNFTQYCDALDDWDDEDEELCPECLKAKDADQTISELQLTSPPNCS